MVAALSLPGFGRPTASWLCFHKKLFFESLGAMSQVVSLVTFPMYCKWNDKCYVRIDIVRSAKKYANLIKMKHTVVKCFMEWTKMSLPRIESPYIAKINCEYFNLLHRQRFHYCFYSPEMPSYVHHSSQLTAPITERIIQSIIVICMCFIQKGLILIE